MRSCPTVLYMVITTSSSHGRAWKFASQLSWLFSGNP
jgi:hypothetical protein